MPLKLNPVAMPSAAARWQVDQHAMTQGLSEAETKKRSDFSCKQNILWAEAARLSSLQPLVPQTSLCGSLKKAIARLEAVSDTLVVIGTGGASLGAQALCAFAPVPGRVLFLENCDAHSVQQVFHRCDAARTSWVIISKSGETVETLATSLAVIAHYEAQNLPLDERVLVITSPGSRPLRALAEVQHWPTLEHPPELGGRYSVFSCVGMVPAAFAGLDIDAITEAARAAWIQALNQQDPDIFAAATWFAASLNDHPLHVVMGYSDRLRPYTQWYKQLWAESLGKNGQGPTPITATGAIDQHSQLQLYLDGAKDKLFTFLLPDGAATPVSLAHVTIPGISYLGGKRMEDIMNASAEATCATVEAKGLPMRVLRAPLDAVALGQLMVRTMAETLLVAAMLGIDPYSQPAVEEGKHRARKSLGLASHA